MKQTNLQDLLSRFDALPLTADLIEALPKLDLHVHLPGTISPKTAWQLGLRNHLITQEANNWMNGPAQLSEADPHTHYGEIFDASRDISFDDQGNPENLFYNIAPNNFKSFDRIMATVQGHRHPPGGIQNEDDLRFVLQAYLKDCIHQNIFYTEIQQNIRIAYHLYPNLSEPQARLELYKLLQDARLDFKKAGVHLRFLNCFNKTQMAGVAQSSQRRAVEASHWLKESHDVAPGLFVGLEAAGHEKDEHGWPAHLKEGYELASSLGFGCEAHGGEGIGVEHMMDVARTLPVSRIAHGFQAIECNAAIAEIKERKITLVMSPIINLTLGACVHKCAITYAPLAQSKGGVKNYIKSLAEHPFFTLLRDHKLPITLCSDNPEMAGIPIQTLMMILAGIKIPNTYQLPQSWIDCPAPMTTAELIGCLVNGIKAAFCDDLIKQAYLEKLAGVLNSFKSGTSASNTRGHAAKVG